MPRRGIFISLEGVEGSGKGTQAKLLAEYITELGYPTVLTHEPGGTPIAEEIREIILNPRNTSMAGMTEILLYLASRTQHVHRCIQPAIAEGNFVVCERFSDSTFAYQGHARGFNLELLRKMNRVATGGLEPDLTILLDIGAEDGLSRKQLDRRDRLERESIDFHNKVREGYITIARNSPQRIKIVNAEGSINDVHLRIRKCVDGKIIDYA